MRNGTEVGILEFCGIFITPNQLTSSFVEDHQRVQNVNTLNTLNILVINSS